MKTNNYLVKAIAVIAIFSILQSCTKVWCIEGKGDRQDFSLELDDFEGVKLNIDADVFITQGDEFHVLVSAQENIFDQMEFKISSGILKIDFDECVWNNESVDIYITMPDIKYAGIAGSGEIMGMNHFTNIDDIEIEILGSGDIDFGIDADKIKTVISGSGDIKLEGSAEENKVRIFGSGSLEAFDLRTDEYDITIDGSGNCEIWVVDELEIRINGSGSVYYVGNPTVDIQINGSGDVVSVNKK